MTIKDLEDVMKELDHYPAEVREALLLRDALAIAACRIEARRAMARRRVTS